MLAYLLIVGISYWTAYRISFSGNSYWRAIAGFSAAFVIAWIGGVLFVAYATSLLFGSVAKDSILPLLGRGFWWALVGAGVGVYRARFRLRTGTGAPSFWTAKWLGKSNRVEPPQPAQPSSQIVPPTRSIKPQSPQVSQADDAIWAQALAEFEGPQRQLGLWARLFAEANGDESAAKAAYLTKRAAEISATQLLPTAAPQPPEQQAAAPKSAVSASNQTDALPRQTQKWNRYKVPNGLLSNPRSPTDISCPECKHLGQMIKTDHPKRMRVLQGILWGLGIVMLGNLLCIASVSLLGVDSRDSMGVVTIPLLLSWPLGIYVGYRKAKVRLDHYLCPQCGHAAPISATVEADGTLRMQNKQVTRFWSTPRL